MSSELQNYFKSYRENISGINHQMDCNGQSCNIVYADWTASGRIYEPIEKLLSEKIYPFVANTHTETTYTGTAMTLAYKKAKEIIKKHVNANEKDILIASNSGMTGVVNKFQRILGLKLHESFHHKVVIPKEEKPIIFVTHMEHHSNHTSWLETIAEVEIIGAKEDGTVDLNHFETLLQKYKHRKLKIAAVTSCSNVTGLFTPYHEIAKMIHHVGGLCFVDFACSAPYIDINMHPQDEGAYLDAIFFSPHKFLGGPGSNGVLIFDSKLYKNKIPDHSGGGTVDFTNPWGEHKYHDEIEAREDGGTPGFLQTIKIALAIQLKERMTVEKIKDREEEICKIAWTAFDQMEYVKVLANANRKRLPIFSFYIDGLHYNLAVKLLNDKYGIQVRGGCSCAGTYGHYLLHVSRELSKSITDKITEGDLSDKPGWIRISFHPTMTDDEVKYCMNAIEQVSLQHEKWGQDYVYNNKANEYLHKQNQSKEVTMVNEWFSIL